MESFSGTNGECDRTHLGVVPPITAQTNPPESSAQLAEFEEAERLDQPRLVIQVIHYCALV